MEITYTDRLHKKYKITVKKEDLYKYLPLISKEPYYNNNVLIEYPILKHFYSHRFEYFKDLSHIMEIDLKEYDKIKFDESITSYLFYTTTLKEDGYYNGREYNYGFVSSYYYNSINIRNYRYSFFNDYKIIYESDFTDFYLTNIKILYKEWLNGNVKKNNYIDKNFSIIQGHTKDELLKMSMEAYKNTCKESLNNSKYKRKITKKFIKDNHIKREKMYEEMENKMIMRENINEYDKKPKIESKKIIKSLKRILKRKKKEKERIIAKDRDIKHKYAYI